MAAHRFDSRKGPFRSLLPLVLASASPRRQAFLDELGLEFRVWPAMVEEAPAPAEDPVAYVLRLAAAKAEAVSRSCPETWVLGADTAVVVDGDILGKPADAREAEGMVKSLAGKRHTVVTGYALCHAQGEAVIQGSAETEVDFTDVPDEVCQAYALTGEPLDKAGGYAIQGCGGFLVESIRGSASNVVGLPLAELVRDLLRLGIIEPRLPDPILLGD
ncbi:MAG: nucleoside triphosphate pyrophosphatase [Thermodesulfobacteriota bacterium]